MSCPTMDHSLAKVGMTRDATPSARANDYERVHGIRWFVFWSAITCNVTAAEAAVHRELQDQRFALVPGATEIFHITPQKAVRVAERHVVPTDGSEHRPGTPTNWLDLYGDALVAELSPALLRIAALGLRRSGHGRRLLAGWSMLSRLFHRIRTLR